MKRMFKTSLGKSALAVTAIAIIGGATMAAVKVNGPSAALVQPWNMSEQGVAISGYDTVAYFTRSEPAVGDESISYAWQGAEWHFSTVEHREIFAADPEQYAPQFGGFCATGMTFGAVAKADPEVWAIVDGRLYLNFDGYAHELFHENLAQNIAKADEKWDEKRATAAAEAEAKQRLASSR